MINKPDLHFWITNVSNLDIGVSDLNITIRANSCINLMDSKHHSYKLQQLIDSYTKGSLYKKRDKLFVRKIPPPQPSKPFVINNNSTIPSRSKSIIEYIENNYEELNVPSSEDSLRKSEEIFAAGNVDLVDSDLPTIIKKE